MGLTLTFEIFQWLLVHNLVVNGQQTRQFRFQIFRFRRFFRLANLKY